MSLTRSLLGLAFASADLLMEVGADGRIGLALGAAPGGGTPETLKGTSLSSLFIARTKPGSARRSASLARDVVGR